MQAAATNPLDAHLDLEADLMKACGESADYAEGVAAFREAAAGWLVAAFHNLVYFGVIPENLQPCSAGVAPQARNQRCSTQTPALSMATSCDPSSTVGAVPAAQKTEPDKDAAGEPIQSMPAACSARLA